MEFREYRVGDILTVQGCKTTRMEKISRDPLGKYEFVSQQATNNGVVFYTNDTPTEPGNSISVDGNCQGYCFYHKNPYLTTNNMIKIMHQNMSENKALYMCSVLNSKIGSFARGYKRSGEKLKLELISLPSVIYEDGSFEPDWDYMENYIKDLKKKINIEVKDEIEIIDNVKKHRGEKIDIREWKEYKTTDIFNIRGTKKADRKENNNGSYGVLTRSTENNGISAEDSTYTEKRNFISLDAFSGKTYYQNKDVFISKTASHIHRIDLKNKILNEEIALFLTTILNLNSNNTRSNAREISDFKKETIKLPSIIYEDGSFEPDWDYMENYIKKLKGGKYEKN